MIYVKAKNLGTIVLLHTGTLGQTKSPRGPQGSTVHNRTTVGSQIHTGPTHANELPYQTLCGTPDTAR